MKGKKLKLIDEIEWSEIDFDLRDEVLGSDVVEQMYEDDKDPGDYIDISETDNYPIQIDKVLKHLRRLKSETTADYIEIDYHCDDIGYIIKAYQVIDIEKENTDSDNRFIEHQRIQTAQLRKVDVNDIEKFIDNGKITTIVNGEEITVSISEADLYNGSPKIGDMIARNPENHKYQWLVAKNYYLENFKHI